MKRKFALGIGVLAVVGAVFWMRALASWRPVTVVKMSFAPTQIHLSGDGEKLLLKDDTGKNAQILNLKTGLLDANSKRAANFFEENGLPTLPRVSPVRVDLKTNSIYSRSGIYLSYSIENVFRLARDGHEGFQTAVSPQRGEIYCELFGSIWIWNAKDKKLKKRVKFAKESPIKSIFSPDGQRLLARSGKPDGSRVLSCYDVQSGKRLAVITQISGSYDFGWSPDGQHLWFTNGDGYMNHSFQAIRALNFRPLWSAECAGRVKWLPDNRIGIVGRRQFSWRDATGRELSRLPGPIQNGPLPTGKQIEDWVISPDGNFIYSAQQSGVIRRWRAR